MQDRSVDDLTGGISSERWTSAPDSGAFIHTTDQTSSLRHVD